MNAPETAIREEARQRLPVSPRDRRRRFSARPAIAGPLPVVIASMVGDMHIFFNLMMAICLLALAPTVILVALLQKHIVEGLSAGAVKG